MKRHFSDPLRLFHREWLGLAQPIEGLVFSANVLASAQLIPRVRAEITAELRRHLMPDDGARDLSAGDAPVARMASARAFFQGFLGYAEPGMLIERDALPAEVSFYAPESGQEIRPTFALARGPFRVAEDPFAIFDTALPSDGDARGNGEKSASTESADADASDATEEANRKPAPKSAKASPYLALVWDLTVDAPDVTLDLDAPEDATGPWRYPPIHKFDRLLRQAGVPIGFLCNGTSLRVVHAPAGEATSHLTFRLADLCEPSGRSLALALELIFHASRTYAAAAEHTFEGLLLASRHHQAEVTDALADQVFEAVERLVAGFEAASVRDGAALDWLRAAQEAGQVYEGALSVVLRLVFLLYAEDRNLLPVDHPFYAQHLSVLALYERLVVDKGGHPESMNQRFGSYGALISLFRAIYFGVRHSAFGSRAFGEAPPLVLPARHGKLFDPSAIPFLEGGLPDWTAAVAIPEDRARVRLPSVDDDTVFEVLHRLIVLDGQRLSYRDLSVEQIGAVYESLMGFRVDRMQGPAVRLGPNGFWVEVSELRGADKLGLTELLDTRAGLTKPTQKRIVDLLQEDAKALTTKGTKQESAPPLEERLLEFAQGGKDARDRHRARTGQLVLQPTASRRSTGSHYTPRSLSERVVRTTLTPLLACLGPSPTADRILELKICDPAMGSGAFLVEACRFLAQAVIAAWQRSGEFSAILEAHGSAELYAKRLVAEKCLYGVDKNPAAVELAKLSLWLETLQADRPFTFLDGVLRHGDSLVGLRLPQIRALHWVPEAQSPMIARAIDNVLEEVRALRHEMQALASDETDSGQEEKRRLLDRSDLEMETVKLIADACVGAFFAHEKPKDREAERLKRLHTVELFLDGDEDQRAELEAWSATIRAQHAPFHWDLEWPEVFFLERPDPLDNESVNHAAFVDAFVGNPPFMGGSSVSSNFGDGYRDWLLDAHAGSHGNADLSAHFFRRAGSLLGAHGTIGFIATNTIAQGDTRETGLQRLVADGFAIHDALRSVMWPGAAAVSVSIVSLAKGAPKSMIAGRSIDDARVSAISSRLMDGPEQADAVALVANANASYLGSKIYGQGFTLTPEERESLIAKNPRNAERIFPYLGGQEVNTGPTQSHDRFVISFGQMGLEEAERWPDLLAIVREKVKPERDLLRDNPDGRRRKEYWWQFGRWTPALYEAIAGLDRCLVTSIHSKHLLFSFQPPGRIFSHAMQVFVIEALCAFAVLQSRIHEPWARLLSSSMKNDLRYAASDCFETFPFPVRDPRAVIPSLESAGQTLYDLRAATMRERQEGLTTTYNRLKNPACVDADVVALRNLHEAMDRAVLEAYGWSDLVVPPYCPLNPAETKQAEAFSEQVIDRLFALNAERAAEEARLGLGKSGGKAKGKAKAAPSAKGAAASKSPTKGATKKDAKETAKPKAQAGLFDDEG